MEIIDVVNKYGVDYGRFCEFLDTVNPAKFTVGLMGNKTIRDTDVNKIVELFRQYDAQRAAEECREKQRTAEEQRAFEKAEAEKQVALAKAEVEKQAALAKAEEELRSKIVAERDRVSTLISDNTSLVVYDLNGVRGRSMKVYTDRVVINTDVTVGSILTNNATDGEKTIFYKDVIGIQFKKPGLTIGYLQLENAAVQMNNKESNFFSENAFTFDDLRGVREAKEYITWQVSRFKQE